MCWIMDRQRQVSVQCVWFTMEECQLSAVWQCTLISPTSDHTSCYTWKLLIILTSQSQSKQQNLLIIIAGEMHQQHNPANYNAIRVPQMLIVLLCQTVVQYIILYCWTVKSMIADPGHGSYSFSNSIPVSTCPKYLSKSYI